jgi:hypothetical protein
LVVVDTEDSVLDAVAVLVMEDADFFWLSIVASLHTDLLVQEEGGHLEQLVLETDAPYLAPVPYRGKRNESAYIVNVLDKLADIYHSTPEEVAAKTTANAKEVFGV